MDVQFRQDIEAVNPDALHLLSFHREVGIRRDVIDPGAVGSGQAKERSIVNEERSLGESKLPVGSRNGAKGESHGKRRSQRSAEEAWGLGGSQATSFEEAGGRWREVPAGGDAWSRGEEMRLKDVSPLEFRLGQRIAVVEGKYFGTMVKVAGTLQKVDLENGEVHLNRQRGDSVVHCCPMDCGALETGDRYLHGIKGRLLTSEVRLEEWMKNLEAVPMAPRAEEDELAELRRRGAEMGLGPRGDGIRASGVKDAPAEAPQKKKKKKDPKEEKEGRAKGKIYDGRHPSLAVQKELSPLFSGTGVDPKEKVRRRALKRAQKYIKKKKSKSSSSSSSPEEEKSSSEDMLETGGSNDGLYAETGRAKYISQKFPGALCSEALRMMKESLLTEVGEDLDYGTQRPVAMMYFRQELQRRGSAVQCRELINLCSSLDLLVRGKAAQRIKACEAAILGSHWSTTQKLEIPVQEGVGIAQRSELQAAHRESYQDSRTRYLSSLNPGARADAKAKGKGEKDAKGGKYDKGPKGKVKGDGDKGRGQGDKTQKDAK